MWRIAEHRRVDKQLAGMPKEILKRYEKWKDIAMISGAVGLRRIKGLHDESLAGQWKGHRSSRLGIAVPDHLPNGTCTATVWRGFNYGARLSEAIKYEGVSSGKKAHRCVSG